MRAPLQTSGLIQALGLTYPGHGETWHSDIDCAYNIDDEACNLAYVCIDVCIDLTPKLTRKYDLLALKDYGKTWVYAYMPEMIWDRFKEYVKAGTGWDVSDVGTVHDPNRHIVAIEANIHHQSEHHQPPSFWVVTSEGDKDEGQFSRLGSIQEVNNDICQQRIHRGIGIFSVSMEVEGTPNSNSTPTPGIGEATLVFTL